MSEGDLAPVASPKNQNASVDVSEERPSSTSSIDRQEADINHQIMPESRHDSDFEIDLIEDIGSVENITPITPKKSEPQSTPDEANKVEGIMDSPSNMENLESKQALSGNVTAGSNKQPRTESESGKPDPETLIEPTTDKKMHNTPSSEILQPQNVEKSIYEPRDPDDGDFDSEDEEFQTLVAAKKKQIRADIVAYQTYLELELVVYEKRLREDFARKKRRRALQINETTTKQPNSKVQQYRLPTFLPLLDGSQNNQFPQSSSTIPPTLTKSKSDHTEKKEQILKLDPIETQNEINQLSAPSSRTSTPSPGLRAMKQVEELKTPPRVPSPLMAPQASPLSTQQPTSTSEPQAKLSFANLAHLDVKEKNQAPLASSIRSTSSWSSGNGKHSRKNSVAEGQERRKKRVVFQLMTDEGDCLRIRPDGEEIPLNESEKEQIKSEIEAAEVLEEEERIRSNIEISEGSPLLESTPEEVTGIKMLSMPAYSDNASVITTDDLSELNDDLGDEVGDNHWVMMNNIPTKEEEQGPSDSLSESDAEDDMFDLDEEVPLQYVNVGSTPSATAAMEESIMSLGLPFAPAPPPPPAGEAVVTSPTQFGLLRRSSNIGAPDTTNVAIPTTQQRSQAIIGAISSSYVSASLPLSSYSLVNPVITDAASPTMKQDIVDDCSLGSAASKANTNHDGPSYTSPIPSQQVQMETAGRGGHVSSSLSSSIRRRSISKYMVKGADESDTEKTTGRAAQNEPVDIETGSNHQAPAVIPVRNAATREADILRSLSPYGTSAPIPIVRRSPVAQAVRPGSVTGNSPKIESAGTPRRRKIGDPLPDITPKKIEKISPMGSLRQYTLKSVEQNATSKSSPDTDSALDDATQSLRRNSLPLTLGSEKPRRPSKEDISKQWDEAHHQFITKPPAIMLPETVKSLEKQPDPNVNPDLYFKVFAQQARFERETRWTRENEMEKNRDSLPLLLSTIKSNTNWVENPVTARPLTIRNDLAETFKDKKVPEEDDKPKVVKPIFERKSVFSSKDAEKVAAEAAASEDNEAVGFVGGVDGRSGIDASLVRHGTHSMKGTKAEGIKPEAMSFSMRMALEEDKKGK